MLKYTRPSGSVIEVNDTEGNRNAARKLGWVLNAHEAKRRSTPEPVIGEEKPKRKRRTKAEMEAARASEESED